ncbi:hypothetical protein QT970_31685 [Microcoleus sp. herbarium8]|uniref:hypothetical protein n=1 Tax=Microcoleus sp. herbarium8 TaxID=3055436 RepID=UPI002FD07F1D
MQKTFFLLSVRAPQEIAYCTGEILNWYYKCQTPDAPYYTKCDRSDRYRYKSWNLDDRTPQRRFLPDREMLPFPGKAKS